MTRHPLVDAICILEEGNQPLPRCDLCGLHAPYTALNGRHPNSQLCLQGQDLRARRALQMQILRARDVTIELRNSLLPSVSTFTCLGRVMTSNNSDWPALYKKLPQGARKMGTHIKTPAEDRCISTLRRLLLQGYSPIGPLIRIGNMDGVSSDDRNTQRLPPQSGTPDIRHDASTQERGYVVLPSDR